MVNQMSDFSVPKKKSLNFGNPHTPLVFLGKMSHQNDFQHYRLINFSLKRRCFPMYIVYPPFHLLCPSQYISLPPPIAGRRAKKVSFFTNFHCHCKMISSACCSLNFDATDLPNNKFEPLYPKVFRGTPKVDLVSTVWPPGLPKVR